MQWNHARRRHWKAALVLLAAAVLSASGLACATTTSDKLQARFSREYDCKRDRVKLKRVSRESYRARGCGRRVTYTCIRSYGNFYQTCVVDNMERTATASVYRPRPAPRRRAAPRPSQPRHKVMKYRNPPSQTMAVEGRAWNDSVRVRLFAAPAEDRETVSVRLRVRRPQNTAAPQACSLQLVADGQRVPLPTAHYKPSGSMDELTLTLSIEDVAKLAQSQRVIGQACDQRFRLDAAHIKMFREFVIQFREEIAFQPAPEPPPNSNSSI